METLLSTLHIVTGVFIVGPMAILPMTAMRSMRAGEAGQVASLAKSTYIFTLLSVLVVFFGFGALGARSFASTWIWLSIVLYVAALALSLFLVVPAMKSASELLAEKSASGTQVAGTKVAGYSRVALGSGIASLLLVAVVVLMVLKPL